MFRGLFGKKKDNVDAIAIANELFYKKIDFNDVNIDKIIKENKIPVKMNDSLKKDIENQYYRLMEIDENIERKNEDKRALASVIKRNSIPVSGPLAKELGLPISAPKKLSMSASDEDEDEWVTSSSSIGGGMKKRRKTKGKRRKSKKNRKTNNTRRKKRY
jgi:hypothetical protein